MPSLRRRAALCLVCVAILAALLPRRSPPPPPPPPGTPIVMEPVETINALFARRRIRRGMRFTSALRIVDHVEKRKNIRKDFMPVARIASLETQLVDLIALETVEKGEPIMLSRFARPEELATVGRQPGPRETLP